MTDNQELEFAESSIKKFVEGEIFKGLEYVRSTRKCPKLKDEDFIMTNIVRVLSESKSGYLLFRHTENAMTENVTSHRTMNLCIHCVDWKCCANFTTDS